jgi:hypothetical protein
MSSNVRYWPKADIPAGHYGSLTVPRCARVREENMLRQLLVGGGISIVNIAIHALVMTILVWIARAVSAKNKSHPAVFLMVVMISTVSVLMAAHVVEVIVWSLAYLMVGIAPKGAGVVYFSFVNYTTLGYGDIIPVERWRLLGPITALNGVILIGWSTAVIFEVLRRALARTETSN